MKLDDCIVSPDTGLSVSTKLLEMALRYSTWPSGLPVASIVVVPGTGSRVNFSRFSHNCEY